jgi:Na+/pantothenate symporter
MTRFTLLDAIVLVAYLAGTTALGLWVGRRQRDAKDYFVADRAIPWWAVMFSIVASETSALTFISTPGLSYGNAPGFGDLGFLRSSPVTSSVASRSPWCCCPATSRAIS